MFRFLGDSKSADTCMTFTRRYSELRCNTIIPQIINSEKYPACWKSTIPYDQSSATN